MSPDSVIRQEHSNGSERKPEQGAPELRIVETLGNALGLLSSL
jgi:hypothetical protein